MRNLDPDHVLIDVDEKIQKVPQIRPVGHDSLEHVLSALRRRIEDLHIFRAYGCVYLPAFHGGLRIRDRAKQFVGKIRFDDYLVLAVLGSDHLTGNEIHGADKISHKPVGRPLVDILGRAELHHVSRIHNRDPVRYDHGLA